MRTNKIIDISVYVHGLYFFLYTCNITVMRFLLKVHLTILI